MKFHSIHKQLWDSDDLLFEFTEEQPKVCVFAQRFSDWTDTLFSGLITEDPTIVALNQAKVLLVDKYFEWCRFVPKSHRMRLGDRGHICIFQIFIQAYERIKLVELSVSPPMLFIPPEPTIEGTLIGLLDE